MAPVKGKVVVKGFVGTIVVVLGGVAILKAIIQSK
jgi:hypothetical protein